MGRKRKTAKKNQNLQKASISKEMLMSQIQSLIGQTRYSEALNKLTKLKAIASEFEISPSEAKLWCLRGKQELEQGKSKQAEQSFQQAIELGQNGEGHYWLAKCLIETGQLAEAVELLRVEFENRKLPLEYRGCYLKILFLAKETKKIENLLQKEQELFSSSQLKWAKGMLALERGELDTAIAYFKKMEQPATPQDRPEAWLIYAQQQKENWAATELILFENRAKFSNNINEDSHFIDKELWQRLLAIQAVNTKKSLIELLNIEEEKYWDREVILVLEMLRYLEAENWHEAGHIAKQLSKRNQQFPELSKLYRPLMVLAGEQALAQENLECSQEFWSEIVELKPFDPNLAVKLDRVLREKELYRQSQRLEKKLLNWLKLEAKEKPSQWPPSKLNKTLAKLNCLLSDSYLEINQSQKGLKHLKEAENLCPSLPEVIGRRGLKLITEGKLEAGTTLLDKALETGYRDEKVYSVLVDSLEKMGDLSRRREACRKFGKYFGDRSSEMEDSLSSWTIALSQLNYHSFAAWVTATQVKEEAIESCKIFVDVRLDRPNNNDRVNIAWTIAEIKWSRQLSSLTDIKQIPVLEAISLSILRFVKRKKGWKGMLDKYLNQLLNLSKDYSAAASAYLRLLVVKGLKGRQLETALHSYLNSCQHPEKELAFLVLEVRRFQANNQLIPYIESALKHEPQNSLLLLAKATKYPIDSEEYWKLKQNAFELARRLQDRETIVAYRDEEAWLASLDKGQMLLALRELEDNEHSKEIETLFSNLRQDIFKGEIELEWFEEILPKLREYLNWHKQNATANVNLAFARGRRAKRSSKSSQKGFQV